MSPSLDFQPFKTQYFKYDHLDSGGAESGLDFLIYVPHGGRIEDFLAQNPELLANSWLTPEQLRDICHMEADAGTRELGEKLTHMLTTQGFRVALMEVLVPREVVDVNRISECAIHPTFDHTTHPKLKNKLANYYDQVIEERKRLIRSLKPDGKMIELHSMRPFDTDTDGKPPPFLSESDAQAYYQSRINALKADGAEHRRTHCLVTKYEGESYPHLKDRLLADPILLDALRTVLNKYRINFNDQDYAFFDHILGVLEPELYDKCTVIDIDKRALLKHVSGKIDLKAEADEAKIETFASYLMEALILAQTMSEQGHEMAAE